MKDKLVIIDGVRTPFCKFGTDLASLAADELGRVAVTALLTKTGIDPAVIDEVIFGCVSQPAESMNIARVIALRAGIPQHVPAMTVHRNCASGLESLTSAYERMHAGHGEIFIVGGTESMSQVPLHFSRKAAAKFAGLSKAKSLGQKLRAFAGFRLADFNPVVALKFGLTDPFSGLGMGDTAEILAREQHISREAQDAFAVQSHQRATQARAKLAEEICPVYHSGKAIVADNGVREDQSLEALAKLRPFFDRVTGTVTAGNSSQITDGAVALLVASESAAQRLGLMPLGYLTGYAYAGCDPERMGLGPVAALQQGKDQYGLTTDGVDLIELNEAFAAQALAVCKQVRERQLGELPHENLNVNGGAIALGHPVGATGSRLVLTALKELHRRDSARALVTLCIGGGQGAAVWLERSGL
jgi:acetyl-CoA acetyltransferase family protein